ncbi:MAG: pentapeptide repeat-containing protein, partial [Caulobacteraceae bacterium]
MTDPVRVCIVSGPAGGLEGEASARLEALGLEPLMLPEDSPAATRQTLLGQCAMLVALYPADPAAHLCMGLAAGMGLPIFVLAAKPDPAPYPAGTRLFANLQALVDAVPAAGKGRHVDQSLLARLGACKEGVDWYLSRYPGGRHSSEWTLKEQVESFADGGAPWLKTAFDYRLIPHHPMDGADLRKADLTGLKLRAGSLNKARLAGARLAGAQIHGTPMAGADLSGALLQQASLSRCDLTGATL